MLIGITGLIGSGKSAAADIFKKHGAFVISADQIGKDVVEKNKTILKKLAKIFGAEILTPTGKLRRKELGRLAFSSEENKEKLNKIVHPALLKELASQSKKALKKNKIVVIDAALLVFWGWDKKVDITILIHTPTDLRKRRLSGKGYSDEEIKERTRSQLSYSELSKHSDIVIRNNSTRNSLEKKIVNLITKLTEIG